MIFGMELYNIVRVVFWSPSGLATGNNRIYFGMYCTLLLAAVAYLLLCRFTRTARLTVRLRIQYAGVAFALLWHIFLNAYDLMAGAGWGSGHLYDGGAGDGCAYPAAGCAWHCLPRWQLCRPLRCWRGATWKAGRCLT